MDDATKLAKKVKRLAKLKSALVQTEEGEDRLFLGPAGVAPYLRIPKREVVEWLNESIVKIEAEIAALGGGDDS